MTAGLLPERRSARDETPSERGAANRGTAVRHPGIAVFAGTGLTGTRHAHAMMGLFRQRRLCLQQLDWPNESAPMAR